MKTLILLVFLLNGILYISCHYSTSTTESIPCDPVILSGNSGRFASPNHPKNYFNDQECTWRITVDEGRKIELKISSIEIEFCSDCECDVLKIYDGADTSANLLKQICSDGGNSTMVKSSSNVLFVVFSTDSSVTRTGFTADYEATCVKRSLMKGGDEKWFNFFDTPKASPVQNALLGSGKVYKGPSSSDVTFTIEGTKLEQFLLEEAILLSRYAKEVKFTFVYNVKKPNKNKFLDYRNRRSQAIIKNFIPKMFKKVIKNSKKWTPIQIKKHKKEMERLLITFIWDSLAGKKGKKVQVRGMKVTVCT